MSSTQQGSNDIGRGRVNKSDKTRRCWSLKEEEILLASLKEIVAQGWRYGNGFKPGYLKRLEEAMKKKFPTTDLKDVPHINSKLTTWKKNYHSLMRMLRRDGVSFNLKGTHMIDCDNDQWEQIVKLDSNARLMRYKSWPLLDDWKEIFGKERATGPFLDDWKEFFGKDQATGQKAEDVKEAVNEILPEENLADAGVADAYHVNIEDMVENSPPVDSVCQSEQGDQQANKKDAGVADAYHVNIEDENSPPVDSVCQSEQGDQQANKKRKIIDGMQAVCELLGDMHRNINARHETLASRIGHEFELGKARKELFNLLSNIPGLSLDDKFDVCEILADKVERLEVFMGLPDSVKPQYVMRLIKSKGK
ncbi:uncharacterized protein LOC131001901 [Salvia miltiorrhiza]|uniref:uncharacterized protein LOC131001901 n=1 Tax=Salvia miltiorrhiza TaxID=226208 RepID=UPI0025AC3F54|nr:uncharacterized protein LOC131001901 [Salvia miltiorrhiza]